MASGESNFLPEDIENGDLGHAAIHNATNDQLNYLTTLVSPGGRLSSDLGGVDLDDDIGPFAAGKGIILTSPDGSTVRRISIDNSGTIVANDPSGPTGYAAEVLADDPISYWRLGEASGTVANDETNTHDGTYVGGVTLATTGLLEGDTNKAITLDGTDDHVVVKSDGAILSGLTNWTFEAVVNKSSADRTLYCERGSSGLDILNIGISSKLKLTYRDHAGTIDQPQQSSSLVLPDERHHVVVTKAGTTVKFYVDGVLDGTFTLTASNTFGESTVKSWIGGDPADGSQWFAGVVDEVALYDTALLSARIAAHAAAVVSA